MLGKYMKHAAIIGACLVALASGFWIAWWQADCTYVARAGALIVAIVVLSEGWIILTTKTPDELPLWTSPQVHSAARVAIILIFLGALIQGYGDLLAKVVFSCH